MKNQQSIWNSVKQLSGSLVGKVGIALILGVLFLGGSLGVSTSQAHAQVLTSASASAPNSADIPSMINQVFGAYGPQAVRVATCESSLNPNVTNSESIGNSRAAGLFQILYPSTWYGTSQAGSSPYDAHANIVAAHDIFVRDGYSWREWVCQP